MCRKWLHRRGWRSPTRRLLQGALSPPECYTLTEQQLCDIMVKELTEGMEGTGVPGDRHRRDRYLEGHHRDGGQGVPCGIPRPCRNGGTHLHPHNAGTRGLEQLEIFKSFGVDLSRVVLSHIDLSADLDYMKRLLDQGVNIAFDTIGKCNYQRCLPCRLAQPPLCGRVRHADRHEHGHHPPQQL